jgi:hypothetical protein
MRSAVDYNNAFFGSSTDERVAAIKNRNWSKNTRDIQTLVYLLTDPFPTVRVAAENELIQLYPGACWNNHNGKRDQRISSIESLRDWSNWILLHPDFEERKNGSYEDDPFDF